MSIRFLSAVVILLAALTAHAAKDDAKDEWRDERAEFVRLYAAVEDGAEGSSQPSEKLRDYPLYPYLQAALLRRALLDSPGLEANDERVENFLAFHGRTLVASELRHAWLSTLAERKQWERFLKHYADITPDDAMRCSSFSARIETNRLEGLAADISKQWLTPRSLQECEQAFEWLRAQNALSPDLIEQRARLALDKGATPFARQIIAMLPAERQAPLLDWANLLEKPQTIDKFIAVPTQPIEPQVLLAGWKRLARTDRDGAIARFDKLASARRLSPREASPYALALALSLSWERRPEALHYFALVDPADLDDVALEWNTRAALWQRDWSLASKTIATMSSEQRNLARWRYWSARSAEQMNNPDLARQLYRSVLADDNYYSAMSAARLDEHVIPRMEKLPLDRTQFREIERLPELLRARELYWSGLRSQAMYEWMRGYGLLSETARAQAVHLAATWGWYDQAVATATQLRIFNDYNLLYPRPFDREVRAAAKLTSLDAELIYGVLRQESLYRTDAVSSAGARGLLQLTPDTARRAARAWKQPRPSADDLFDPRINVPLGAANLRTLIDRFSGQTPVALAGYNAGPNAAARWLPNTAVDSDIWIENIPYNETRAYVQRVLWHSIVFGWLKSGDAQRTDAWISRIAPTSNSAMVGSAD